MNSNFNEFKDYLLQNIKDYLPHDMQDSNPEYVEVPKNGYVAKGIVMRKESVPCPTIYVDAAFARYEAGEITMNEAVKEIASDLAEADKHRPDINLENVFDFDAMKDKIFFSVVNFKDNVDGLRDVAYLRKGDFAKVLRMEFNEEMSAKISKDLMQKWGTTIDELDQIANDNSMIRKPAELFDMNQMFLGTKENLLGKTEYDRNMPLYVLSSSNSGYGAAAIFYPEIMDMVSDFFEGDKFYILPSSTQEVILLADPYKDKDPRDLGEMVREANKTCVSRDEKLGDCAYEYNRDTKEIIAVAESREKSMDYER